MRVGEHDLGTVAGRAGARKVLGFVPQRFSVAPEMRVRATVAYAGWVNGLPDRECDEAADVALQQAGLADKARARVRSLSGGQRQRLGIAAGLVHDPHVLVLDEPTAGLAPGQRLRVRELIAALGAERTVVISSHRLEDISQLCDRVGVLANGRLVFDGSVPELTRLIDDSSAGSEGLGSAFERAYDKLVANLEGQSEGVAPVRGMAARAAAAARTRRVDHRCDGVRHVRTVRLAVSGVGRDVAAVP